MPARILRARERLTAGAEQELRDGIARIQREQDVSPAFPAEVEEAAAKAAASPRVPALDLTDVPFVTLDPASSMDLDQALHLTREGDGFTVRYAIADLAAFLEPGGVVDAEARRRGQTLYGADSKIPLHPLSLSEGAASLLPDVDRPALVWTVALDAAGAIGEARVERAVVRSRAKLSYVGAQHDLEAGTGHGAPDGVLPVLRDVGTLRLQQEVDRGGVSLPIPEQEVVVDGDQWRLEYHDLLPVEVWNAQISLLTGIAAARMMLEHRVGVLRTLPPAPQQALDRLRRTAKALGIPWPGATDYPTFVRSLDPAKPTHAAMLVAATRLLRGASYAAFDGELPALTEHAALATPYAHVTAPLRRLVDRFGLETCVALTAGHPVPSWVTEAFPDLPKQMQDSGRKAGAYEGAVLDLVEAEVLKGSVGRPFDGVVLEADEDAPAHGKLQVADPAVEARVEGTAPLPVGEAVSATLAEADPATRRVSFSWRPGTR